MSHALWDAVGRPESIALVGGGGKTTLAFRLLKEGVATGLKRTLFTTTTRVRVPKIPHQVDVLLETMTLEEAVYLVHHAFEEGHQRVALISSREVSDAHGPRAVGIPTDWIEVLSQFVDLLVVESDGSRMLPFKAPRLPMEPVIPMGIKAVFGVVGLDVLGVPLDEVHVCRSDVVMKVAGAQEGEMVTPEMVGKVMGNRDLWCHQLSHEVPYHVIVNKAGCWSVRIMPLCSQLGSHGKTYIKL